jgi:SAM-dependent methyltransferase
MESLADASWEAFAQARFQRQRIYEAPSWYDVDYAGVRGELAFYRLLLRRALEDGGAYVELGAGTGRLCLPLAAEGVRVHAVEPARPMRQRLIEHAQKLALPAGRLSVEGTHAHTFRGPAERCDVISFPFNGVMHLQTRAALVEAFAHACAALAPEGLFGLDVTGPYWDAMMRGGNPWTHHDERVHPTTGERVLTADRSVYDPDTRTMRIYIRFLAEGAPQGVELLLEQTMWTWQEVLSALDEAGLAVDLLFGDLDLRPFTEGSPRLLVAARRASRP